MPSVRQQILTELLARLATIAIAGGFQTDAGQLVRAGETPQLGPDDPDAAIAVLVRDDLPFDMSGFGEAPEGITVTVLPIEIQAVVKADLEQPLVSVESVNADIRQAIETSDRSLGGILAKALTRGRTRTYGRQPGSTVVGSGVEYRAVFAEGWGGEAI
jgi:hypothetical protein